MLYLYSILFFLKNFYEKIDVRIQILKRQKLNPQYTQNSKRSSDVFRSKIDLRVEPYQPGKEILALTSHLFYSKSNQIWGLYYNWFFVKILYWYKQ